MNKHEVLVKKIEQILDLKIIEIGHVPVNNLIMTYFIILADGPTDQYVWLKTYSNGTQNVEVDMHEPEEITNLLILGGLKEYMIKENA